MPTAMRELPIPAGLDWLCDSDEGRAWLDALPGLVASCTRRWDLRLGEPFPGSYVSWVAPVIGPHGEDVVLKVQFPHRESEHEATALAAWDGNGAVRLLDHAASDDALLLERCLPGVHLSERPAHEALEVFADLLPRLWVPPPAAIGTIATEATWWADGLVDRWERTGRGFGRSLVDAALDLLDRLPRTQGELVLVHQDLHADNVLAASRKPWLAIDPKPLAAEREFSLAPIIRSHELGHRRELVVDRLDRLSAALGVDRERARLWALAQAVAWGMEDGHVLPRNIETATWLADA